MDKPSRGEVHLGGVRIGAKTPDSVLADIRLHNLGFVFQVGLCVLCLPSTSTRLRSLAQSCNMRLL